jgi:putative membrane protein
VTLRWILATLHLLGMAMSVASILARARAFRGTLDTAGLRRVFAADNMWGVSFLVMLSTGLWRVLGGVEKGADYYLSQPTFHAKMGLLVLILILELRPMITLIRWRVAMGRGQSVDTSRASAFARLSTIQGVLVLLMVFAATALARGIGF